MNYTGRVLTAISAMEPCSFNEFLRGLDGEKPENRDEWRVLFQTLEMFEASGLVEIERTNDRIDTLILTPLGAERARETLRDKNHGL